MLGAALLVPFACAYPLLEAEFDSDDQGDDQGDDQAERAEPSEGELGRLSDSAVEIAVQFVPLQAMIAYEPQSFVVRPIHYWKS